MAILPDNEFYTFEDRQYLNPQVSLNEQNSFVDNLRNVQKTNNDQINMQTYNLGTAVPSSVGGLTGANSYFSSRYQTPQMNSLASNLRATAQAKALNDVLANEQAKMQKRYTEAYQKSQIRGSNGGGGGNGTTTTPTGNPLNDGNVKTVIDSGTEQGSTSQVGETDLGSSWDDGWAGKNDYSISYTIGDKRYYANVHNKTGFSTDRGVGLDTSSGMSYSGQYALDFLNSVVNSGGKIYSADGTEITPYQALTSGM